MLITKNITTFNCNPIGSCASGRNCKGHRPLACSGILHWRRKPPTSGTCVGVRNGNKRATPMALVLSVPAQFTLRAYCSAPGPETSGRATGAAVPHSSPGPAPPPSAAPPPLRVCLPRMGKPQFIIVGFICAITSQTVSNTHQTHDQI